MPYIPGRMREPGSKKTPIRGEEDEAFKLPDPERLKKAYTELEEIQGYLQSVEGARLDADLIEAFARIRKKIKSLLKAG